MCSCGVDKKIIKLKSCVRNLKNWIEINIILLLFHFCISFIKIMEVKTDDDARALNGDNGFINTLSEIGNTSTLTVSW